MDKYLVRTCSTCLFVLLLKACLTKDPLKIASGGSLSELRTPAELQVKLASVPTIALGILQATPTATKVRCPILSPDPVLIQVVYLLL